LFFQNYFRRSINGRTTKRNTRKTDKKLQTKKTNKKEKPITKPAGTIEKPKIANTKESKD